MLAGTAARGAGAEDDRLAAALLDSAKDRAEHAWAVDSLVARARALLRRLTAPAEPALLTLANVRHLASDVAGTQRGRSRPAGLLELVGAVHPTAAVCGTPTPTPPRSSASSRAWTAAATPGRSAGWTPAATASSAWRCAAPSSPRDGGARLFAGCGIVAGSEPAAELAETQAKFAAFQAALEG